MKRFSLSNYANIFFAATLIEIFLFSTPFVLTIDGYSLNFGLTEFIRVLSLFVFNYSIFYLISCIDDEIHNRKILYSRSIFNRGIGTFSFIITLVYCLMFVVKYHEFKLTCDKLYSSMNKVIDVFGYPLGLSMTEQEDIKTKLANASTSLKIRDVLGINGENSTGDFFSGENLSGMSSLILDNKIGSGGLIIQESGSNSTGMSYSGFDLAPGIDKITKGLLINGFGSGEDQSLTGSAELSGLGAIHTGLIGKFNSFKNMLFTQVLTDKKLIDSGVCGFMINEIGKRYYNPQFKFSVVVLMWFLIFPFVRLLFLILGVINLIIFKLFTLFGVYKIRIITDEVEEIV